MANFDFDFPEDMLSGLDSILDDVAPKMIEEALPIYEKAVKNKLEKHRDTGELIASIHCKQSKTKTGAYIGYLTADGSSGKTTYKRKNGKTCFSLALTAACINGLAGSLPSFVPYSSPMAF